MTRRATLGILSAALAATAFSPVCRPAFADGPQWPQAQPLNLIVPFGPGSSPDTVARLVAAEAGKTLGQTIVVQNRAGASGNIGTDQIAKAKPDGYTFGVSITGPLVNNALIYPKLPYDPATDLVPLTLGVHQYNVLVVAANSPLKTAADLFARMKEGQAKLTFPSTGAGTVSHLAIELLLQRAGGTAVHVPYKSSPDAVTSLISGDTDFAALPAATVVPMIRDGRLRALAAVAAKRLPYLPQVPTMPELGYPGVEGSGWIGFVAPAGIAEPVVRALGDALRQALASTDVAQRLTAMYMEPAPTTPAAFAAYMKDESARWTPVIRRLNLHEG